MDHRGDQNKVLYPLSKPDDFVLALVEFLSDNQHRVHQLSRPFEGPRFRVTSVNHAMAELIARAEEPR
ncbi:MAG: hypothetical protein R3A10_03620 [Caldilineaceae bacterium]